MNPSIPNSIQSAVKNLIQDVEKNCGDRFISAVLYDGMVKNKDVKETDTIKIMFVFDRVDVDILDSLAPSLKSFKKSKQLKPLFLSEHDLQSSADVFPIRFLDMQQDHELLAGRDVLENLEIHRDHLRLRCEQEIKNLMLRLRGAYVVHSQQKHGLSSIMLRTFYALLPALDVMAELKNNKTYRNQEEILDAAHQLGLDVSPLRRLQSLRAGEDFSSLKEEKQTFDALMTLLSKAAVVADEMS